nr:MAG TPA: hypothetical protein [Bacteriophage sp.]
MQTISSPLIKGAYFLEPPIACGLLPYGIVVGLHLSIKAADYPLKKSRGFNLALIQPIFSVFTTFTPIPLQVLRCSLVVFRTSQQLNKYFFIQLTLYAD